MFFWPGRLIFPPTFDPEELRLIVEVTAVADVAEVEGVSIGVDLVSMDMALLKYLFFLRLSLSADEFPEFLVLLSCWIAMVCTRWRSLADNKLGLLIFSNSRKSHNKLEIKYRKKTKQKNILLKTTKIILASFPAQIWIFKFIFCLAFAIEIGMLNTHGLLNLIEFKFN